MRKYLDTGDIDTPEHVEQEAPGYDGVDYAQAPRGEDRLSTLYRPPIPDNKPENRRTVTVATVGGQPIKVSPAHMETFKAMGGVPRKRIAEPVKTDTVR